MRIALEALRKIGWVFRVCLGWMKSEKHFEKRMLVEKKGWHICDHPSENFFLKTRCGWGTIENDILCLGVGVKGGVYLYTGRNVFKLHRSADPFVQGIVMEMMHARGIEPPATMTKP
ncbi:hypothetical protein HOI18_02445 [Candidatus Uhrbacteria bacterium]|jgi:hypothetical protein|nr:hypothetical protein [Candidatus Uhrbacteria bacterium]